MPPQLDFRREYLVRLPLPLAQLYSRAYNAKDARGRHDNAFYLFEALIKLAAAPLVACYLHEVEHGQQRVPALDRLLAQLALPSLGQWVAILRELSRFFGQRADAAAHPLGHVWNQLNAPRKDLPALVALYRQIKNGPDEPPGGDQSCSILEFIDKLVTYRNGVFGHGAARFDSFYDQQMGPLLFPAINDLLSEGVLDLLGPVGSRLVYVTELRTVDESRVQVGLRELVGLEGERMAPLELETSQTAALLPNRVAVLWPGRPAPLRLDPLLQYRESDLAEEVLFLNRDRNGRQVEYLSYTTGRTERDKSMLPAMAALLSRVTNREIAEADLQRLTEQSIAETPSVEQLFETPHVARHVGDYELLAEIGRGGMGVVYLARQLSLGRLVALKMLPADLAGDEVALARFRREIRHLARCEHPNIIKVLSSGTLPDGQIYYTMEYVPGSDLEMVWRELSGPNHHGSTSTLGNSTWASAVLSASRKRREKAQKSRGGAKPVGQTFVSAETETDSADKNVRPTSANLPLPPLPELPSITDDPGGYVHRVVMLVRDAALALQAVHDQGIIHRDVKPANLMLTPDSSRLVLMDFGLAKGESLAMSASRSAGFLGTLRYSAPEQLAAATLKVGPAADVRGLGVTLWELLTRQRLFGEAEDEAQLAHCVHEHDVPRLRTVDPQFDRDLEAIVARATERRTSDRTATAGQFAEYLQLYLDGKPLPIRPPGSAELLRRWIREHRPLVSSMMAAAVVIVVTTAISFQRISAAKMQAEDTNTKLIRKNEEIVAAQRKLQDQLALNYIEQGASLAERGSMAEAVATFHRAYSSAVEIGFVRKSALNLLSGWEASLPRVLQHASTVSAVAFSPDGQTVLTGSYDKTARLWDAATGKPRGEPMMHDEAVYAVAFSPDGQTALTGSWDKTARLWDAATGKPRGEPMQHDDRVGAVAFSPDGQAVLTGSYDNTARLWDFATGKPRGEPMKHDDVVGAVAFSPDGQTVLTGSWDNTARLWDAATGKPRGEPMKHDLVVGAVAFSPDGQTVLTGSWDKKARLWDAATGKPRGEPMQHDDRVGAVAFSPDGQAVLTGSYDNTARLWDAATGKPRGEPMMHDDGVWAVAFSPDGQGVLTGSADETARLWDAATGKPRGEPMKHDDVVGAVAFSPDGQTVLTGSWDNTARLWDAATGKPRGAPMKHDGHVHAVAFSPDGQAMLTGSEDKTARLWDAATGKSRGEPIIHDDGVLAVAFSPDGQTVLTGSFTTARLWDAATGKPRGAPMMHDVVAAVAFSPDGQTVLTGSWDKTARLWDAATGKPRGEPMNHDGHVYAVAFSPDGQAVLTGSEDKTARLWDAATGKPRGEPMKHDDHVHAVAFSPDGQTVLTGSWDKKARLWDAATGKPRCEPMKHDHEVGAVAFSPDGQTVLTGSEDKTARLWDFATGKPRGAPMKHDHEVGAVAFSPDGQAVLTGSWDKTPRLWNVPTSIADEAHFLSAWVVVRTGLAVDETNSLKPVSQETWLKNWRVLETVGQEWLKQREDEYHAARSKPAASTFESSATP